EAGDGNDGVAGGGDDERGDCDFGKQRAARSAGVVVVDIGEAGERGGEETVEVDEAVGAGDEGAGMGGGDEGVAQAGVANQRLYECAVVEPIDAAMQLTRTLGEVDWRADGHHAGQMRWRTRPEFTG